MKNKQTSEMWSFGAGEPAVTATDSCSLFDAVKPRKLTETVNSDLSNSLRKSVQEIYFLTRG